MLKSSSSMGPCMVESSSEEQQDAALPHEILDNDHVMPAKGTAPLQFWDNASLCMVRICQGQKIKATMKQHESGFLTAKFKGDPPIQTEVPNLVLKGGGLQVSTASGSKAGGKKCVKKPAASIPSMKKPAAASLPKESPEEEGPEDPEEDGEEGEDLQEAPAVAPPRCGGGGGGGPPDDEGFDNNSPMPDGCSAYVLYYKKNNAIGIRLRRPNTKKEVQVFSFGHRRSAKSKEQMKDLGYKIVAHLKNDGWTLRAARDWALEQIRAEGRSRVYRIFIGSITWNRLFSHACMFICNCRMIDRVLQFCRYIAVSMGRLASQIVSSASGHTHACCS